MHGGHELLLLDEALVRELLPMDLCIEVMREALRAAAGPNVVNPLRSLLRAPEAAGLLGLMPAFRGGERPLYSLKEVCVFPGNPAKGLESHIGSVLLHDGDDGRLLAVVHAAAITEIRTAAVSAVATDLLARPDSTTLAIIGSGAQARAHLEALPLVRPITEVRVATLRYDGRMRVMQELAERRGIRFIAAESIEAAVRAASIVVTTTSSREPILQREWIGAGTHINAVGSSSSGARELASAVVATARLFVDRRESTVNESGDYLMALRDGAIRGPEHIRAELGELLEGRGPGRTSPEEITLFKSLGLAIEDLAAAAAVYERALAQGRGMRVRW